MNMLYNIIFSLKGALNIMALFILFNSAFSQFIPNVKSSSFFVKNETLLDSTKIDSILTFANNNQITKLFIDSFTEGYAIYNSSIIPNHPELDSLFDPLSYILRKNLNENIEIHASIDTYLLWTNSIPPENKNHLYYVCEDCFESDFNGKSDRKIDLYDNQSKNWEGIFLSPLHPNVNQYILSIVEDLLNNYNLDGINLKNIRYQDSYYGYNKDGISSFINEFDFDPRDLNRGLISSRFGFEQSHIDSLYGLWNDFRIGKVTQLVRSVKYKTIGDSLNITLSASVKPNYILSKDRWYQDWESWINENLLDFVIIENYDLYNEFIFNNKFLIENKFSYVNQGKIHLAIKPSIVNMDNLTEQIFHSRLLGFKSFLIFPSSEINDSLNIYEPLYNVINFNLY